MSYRNRPWSKDDDDCETYFGINIQNAKPEIRKIIHECIEKEKRNW